MRSILVTLLALPVAGQVQSNSPEATLEINGRTGDGFADQVVQELMPGSTLSIVVRGTPEQPLVLAFGNPLEPGLALPPFGVLNLVDPLLLLNGFDPFGLGLFAFTDATGEFDFELTLPETVPFGTELTFQASVLEPLSGVPVLTAPETLRAEPAALAYYDPAGGYVFPSVGNQLFGTNPLATSQVRFHPPYTNLSMEVDAFRWSPDGTRMAYVAHFVQPPFHELLVSSGAGYHGGEPTLLSGFLPVDKGLAPEVFEWSPDGTRIAFAADATAAGEDDRYDLFVVDLADHSVQRVDIGASGDVVALSWSPDGSRIAYAGTEVSSLVARWLVLVDPDGGNPVTLFDPQAGDEVGLDFLWSPDGSVLAYRAGEHDDLELHLAQADSGTVTTVAQHVAFYGKRFAWAPDGSRIAYRVRPETIGFERLWTTRSDGTGTVMISGDFPPEGGRVRDFAWSPDSQRLAYSGDQTWHLIFELFVNSVEPATPNSHVKVSGIMGQTNGVDEFAWSPDGEWLAYRADRDDYDVFELYSAPYDGTALFKINGPLTDPPHNSDVAGFAWNPDPAKLLLAYDASEDTVPGRELYFARPNGAGKFRIGEDIGIWGQGSNGYRWDPSGQWMAFTSSKPDSVDGVLYITDSRGEETNFDDPIEIVGPWFSPFVDTNFMWAPE